MLAKTLLKFGESSSDPNSREQREVVYDIQVQDNVDGYA